MYRGRAYVWSSNIIARVRINRVRLPILLWSAEQGKLLFPCPRVGSAVQFSRFPRRRPFIRYHRVNPDLLGHANAYRWHSLPKVRWHRGSSSPGSSKRVLRYQITMDQLICASLSRVHYIHVYTFYIKVVQG